MPFSRGNAPVGSSPNSQSGTRWPPSPRPEQHRDVPDTAGSVPGGTTCSVTGKSPQNSQTSPRLPTGSTAGMELRACSHAPEKAQAPQNPQGPRSGALQSPPRPRAHPCGLKFGIQPGFPWTTGISGCEVGITLQPPPPSKSQRDPPGSPFPLDLGGASGGLPLPQHPPAFPGSWKKLGKGVGSCLVFFPAAREQIPSYPGVFSGLIFPLFPPKRRPGGLGTSGRPFRWDNHSHGMPGGGQAAFSPEGTVLRSQCPSFSSRSRISQLNIPGFSRLYSSIFFSTSGVATCFCAQGAPGVSPRVRRERKRERRGKALLIQKKRRAARLSPGCWARGGKWGLGRGEKRGIKLGKGQMLAVLEVESLRAGRAGRVGSP